MVSKKRDPIQPLRETKTGSSTSHVGSMVEHYGFECVRAAKHGLVYEHPELHDAGLHDVASIMIPKGRELRKCYATDVLKAVEAVVAHRKERAKDDPS